MPTYNFQEIIRHIACTESVAELETIEWLISEEKKQYSVWELNIIRQSIMQAREYFGRTPFKNEI
jgi:hypothetical protein